ncbi:MAG: hypothetical protein LC721_09345 [Actinobacteria bacterium]|nr:hypothetical protein [Actinomycetota bacterium]
MTPSARHYRRVRSAARITAVATVALLAGLAGADLPALAQVSAPTPTADKVTTWFARLTPDADASPIGPKEC